MITDTVAPVCFTDKAGGIQLPLIKPAPEELGAVTASPVPVAVVVINPMGSVVTFRAPPS